MSWAGPSLNLPILGPERSCRIVNFVDSIKQGKSTATDKKDNIKHIFIRKIDLNIGNFISDNVYRTILKININAECGYYLVKWASYC